MPRAASLLMRALLPVAAGAQPTQIKLPDDVELVHNVEFGKGQEQKLTLHAVRPMES